jgi:hypothetical protein
MRLAPLFALFALLFGVLYALTDQKPTFDQAVSQYYRNVALMNVHQLQYQQIILTDSKAVDASIEAMRQRCDGTFEGLDKFEPVCKPKPEPAPVSK